MTAPCSQSFLPLHDNIHQLKYGNGRIVYSCVLRRYSIEPSHSFATQEGNVIVKRKAEVAPSIASSRHFSRACVTANMTAFSKAGSLRGSLASSITVLFAIKLAFLDASLQMSNESIQ